MRSVVPILAACLLAACSSVPPLTPDAASDEAWVQHRAALADLTEWTVTGRISIQSEDQAWNATLYWRQRGDSYRIRLLAPLGQGTVQVAGDANGVTLRTPDNETFDASDPETLLFDALGWRLPLDGLRFWLRGLDAPGSGPAERRLDPWGRLGALRQDGWDIDYRRYAEDTDPALPAKVFLKRGPLAVRIVVNQWRLGRL